MIRTRTQKAILVIYCASLLLTRGFPLSFLATAICVVAMYLATPDEFLRIRVRFSIGLDVLIVLLLAIFVSVLIMGIIRWSGGL